MNRHIILCVLFNILLLSTSTHGNIDTSEDLLDFGEFLQIFTNPDSKLSKEDGEIFCNSCVAIVDFWLERLRNGTSQEQLAQEVIEICNALPVFNEAVCEGAVNLHMGQIRIYEKGYIPPRQIRFIFNFFQPILYYIASNSPDLDGLKSCGIVAQSYGCTFDNPSNWEIFIHEGTTVEKAQGNYEPLTILHLTDIHFDPNYSPGKTVNCNLPVCCQFDTPEPENGEAVSGFWASYGHCDTPEHTIDASLEFIKENHHLDLIYYTGDIISHRAWATDAFNNSKDISLVFNKIYQTFPDVPFFPILGNHEPHPFNIWSNEVEVPEFSTQWLFDLSAELWGHFLPEETYDTIKKGGFYTVLVRPGFRIVALNSNVCFFGNWWLLYDDVDPYDQLAWFENVMFEAENNNEIVHILSHVPSGDGGCYEPWSRQFNRILKRYSNSVAAIFNGHTHLSELEIYFDSEDPGRATNVAWNGGALTGYTDNNPNYRLYFMDSMNYDILDLEDWYFNSTEANLTPDQSPNFKKLYNFKTAFGLTDLTPQSLADLAFRMTSDSTLTDLYEIFAHRDSDALKEKGCDLECAKNIVCRMVTTLYGQTTQCDFLLSLMETF